jgi:predicted enzyme related to lactoylglutathione lyase
MLRIAKVESFEPAPFTVLGFRVEEIEAEVDRLANQGIGTERYEGFAQDDRGITTFPDGTRVAWFKDPDGNLLSLAQFQR